MLSLIVQTLFSGQHIDLNLRLLLPCFPAPHEPQMQGSVNGKYDSLSHLAMCCQTAKFGPKRIALLAIKNYDVAGKIVLKRQNQPQ